MAANNDNLHPRWHELKGGLKHRWAKLTDDDISKMAGSQEELAFALRRRYGYAIGQAVMEINRWITDYDKDNPVRRRR
ncbi:MAG: CsbD family protein [Chloroflexi bacterium]|nr:CsbD family protein [Chloroflexota bacterium]